MESFYYIFWSIMSAIAVILAGGCFIYLTALLKEIKQSLDKIEAQLLVAQKEAPKPPAKRRGRPPKKA